MALEASLAGCKPGPWVPRPCSLILRMDVKVTVWPEGVCDRGYT